MASEWRLIVDEPPPLNINVMLFAWTESGDNWKMIRYNFWPRPEPYSAGSKTNAFNGFSVGKGHLAEAKAAINFGVAAPKSMFDHDGSHGNGSSCGNGDTSQRDELLAKVREAKKV